MKVVKSQQQRIFDLQSSLEQMAPAPKPPVPIVNRRGFRLTLGLIVILLAALVLAPRLVSYAAVDAIVQGRAALVATPIEGTVHSVNLQPGQAVARGEVIAAVENPRLDRSFLNELLTERNYLQRRVESLGSQALGLMDLRADLETRSVEVSEGAARVLEKEIVARQAELTAARAQLAASESELVRQTSLMQSGHTPARVLEAARTERDSLLARADQLTAQIELLREEQAQARQGIFMADGRFGSPYAEIRRDEIDITLLDIYSRRQQEQSRIEQIDRQIAAEEARLSRVAEAAIEAPFDGLVWKVLTPRGSEVVIGAEIAEVLDCTSTFLEILVSETRFDRISVGDEVRYRLIGADAFRTGRVSALRGGNVHSGDRSLAATLDASRDRDFRVWAELDPSDAAAKGEAFCNVGRHADVRFEQSVDPLAWARGLWSAL